MFIQIFDVLQFCLKCKKWYLYFVPDTPDIDLFSFKLILNGVSLIFELNCVDIIVKKFLI